MHFGNCIDPKIRAACILGTTKNVVIVLEIGKGLEVLVQKFLRFNEDGSYGYSCSEYSDFFSPFAEWYPYQFNGKK